MSEEARKVAPRIALLTCRHHDHIDHASEGKLMQALVRRGAVVTLLAWDDVLAPLKDDNGRPVAELVYADLFVLRTTWDYWDRLDSFKQFVNALKEGERLLNSADTVLANLDKTYLKELEAQGVPIVPTIFVRKGGEAAAVEEAATRGWSAVVAKPSVGAAASGLRRFERVDGEVVDYLRTLTASGTALLQAFQSRVVSDGETSLVYFDGAFSHAVTKVPAAGDFRSQVDFGGVYSLVEPTAAQRGVAERALAAWQRYADKPLYARVDLVPGEDGEPLLGELELIEPELFLDMAESAAEMFAVAILARVKEPTCTDDPWWYKLISIVGCLAIACVVLFIFFAGVVAILVSLFGGP